MALIEKLNAIGNAIREKNGTIDLISLAEMPQAILDIKGDCDISDDSDMMPPHYSGASYTDITYNEDNTITLTEKDGTEHTMVCTYEDDMLVSVTYDGKAISLTYDGEDLVKVGNTIIDLSGHFSLPVRAEIEITEGGTRFYNDGGTYNFSKANDGWSIAGYYRKNLSSQYCPILIAKTPESAVMIFDYNGNQISATEFEYDGETYYYSTSNARNSIPTMLAGYTDCLGTFDDENTIEPAIKLLDYYFMKDEVAE